MAKLEGVKVIDMNNGEVTKITFNGEEYAKVDGAAKKGDILLSKENEDDIEMGDYFKCTSVDYDGDVEFFDNDDDDRTRPRDAYEVFRKVNESATDKPTAERLNVGDLAKVIKEKDDLLFHNYDLTDIVKVINIGGEEVFNCVRLSDSLNQGLYAQYLQRYTPQAGDKLTIDGVEYTLEERVAEVGEKVIVVANGEVNGPYHDFANYTIVEATGEKDDEDELMSGKGIYGYNITHYVRHGSQYLVLSPTVTVSESEAVTSEPTPITFVIKTKTGDIHEVIADDDVVTAAGFVEIYRDYGFIANENVAIPISNIDSITIK